MLQYSTDHFVRVDMLRCLDCLLDPRIFLGSSEYTESVREVREGVYEIVFRWRKFGITRRFKVLIRPVKRPLKSGVEVVYEPEPDSPYWFTIRIVLYPGHSGVFIKAEALMKAGLMADLLGRKDYAGFVEKLVSKGLTEYLKHRIRDLGDNVVRAGKGDCRDCILYDEVRGYCYFLESLVPDPFRPPCGGRAHALISEAAEKGA